LAIDVLNETASALIAATSVLIAAATLVLAWASDWVSRTAEVELA
jgi:hypothetical protein